MTGFTVPSLSDMYCACYQKIYMQQLDPGVRHAQAGQKLSIVL